MHEAKSFQPRDVLTSPTISLVSVMPKILKCHTYSSFSLFFVVEFIAYRIIIEDILDLLYLHIHTLDVKYNLSKMLNYVFQNRINILFEIFAID